MTVQGHRAAVLFVVQRMDCESFSACAELDPLFARTLDDVADQGVEVLVYACDVAQTGIAIARRLPWLRAP
jgi:sugar fermentation stimulation protein A